MSWERLGKGEKNKRKNCCEKVSHFRGFLSVVYWNSNLPQNGKSFKERVVRGERVFREWGFRGGFTFLSDVRVVPVLVPLTSRWVRCGGNNSL